MRPKRIKLGAYTIPVKYHTALIDVADDGTVSDSKVDGEGDFGCMELCDKWHIHVSEHSDDMGATLLHEALHAVTRTSGVYRIMGDRDGEEAIVSAMSRGVIELLRRNPGLTEFLVNPDKAKPLPEC